MLVRAARDSHCFLAFPGAHPRGDVGLRERLSQGSSAKAQWHFASPTRHLSEVDVLLLGMERCMNNVQHDAPDCVVRTCCS